MACKTVSLIILFTFNIHQLTLAKDEKFSPVWESKEIKAHDNLAIESLINEQKIITNSKLRVYPKANYETKADKFVGPRNADISIINATFVSLLLNTRNSKFNSSLKQATFEKIRNKFESYNLQVIEQSFNATSWNGNVMSGVNIIAIREGENRGKEGDKILLLGAHCDTVPSTFGIDDNGSGVVALLEIARLLNFRNETFDYTIMFVAFDLEEYGLLGSIAFVKDYLIPYEINSGVKFIGAYILDMVLTYNNSAWSQRLPSDFVQTNPSETMKIYSNGGRGDFMSVWKRDVLDDALWNAYADAWNNVSSKTQNKLYKFSAPIPANASRAVITMFSTYSRSDHAAFWHQANRFDGKPFRAVLINDMGPFRERTSNCYHRWCDDQTQLSAQNLAFMKHAIEALFNVVVECPDALSQRSV